MNQYAQPTN
jgi:hypothetical protein